LKTDVVVFAGVARRTEVAVSGLLLDGESGLTLTGVVDRGALLVMNALLAGAAGARAAACTVVGEVRIAAEGALEGPLAGFLPLLVRRMTAAAIDPSTRPVSNPPFSDAPECLGAGVCGGVGDGGSRTGSLASASIAACARSRTALSEMPRICDASP
jgi:hypothetical protein